MEFVKITSAQNDAVKHVIKLRDRRPREKEQLTVLEGYRELTRAREYGMELLECFFSPSHFLGENEFPLLETLASEGVRVVEVAPQLLEKMAYRERPEGLIAVAKDETSYAGRPAGGRKRPLPGGRSGRKTRKSRLDPAQRRRRRGRRSHHLQQMHGPL